MSKELKIYYLHNKLHIAVEEDGVVKCSGTFTDDLNVVSNYIDFNKILAKPIHLKVKDDLSSVYWQHKKKSNNNEF